ncbi:DUF3313 family protein [Massilia orientalis]|jgi:hypothetical protein|uniref:DUF3313 family protein n=1 Tax=Massilia orientalis TaxID=3050128 RepID=A0ACC7M662_9BURK|nr:DUF3313 family protein [Massilia sp. YIM B02787]
MNKQSASICSGLFLCIAGALSGCATNGMTRSGFLDTYETLAPTRYKHVLMFREPGFDPGRYAEVVVEHPLIKTSSGRIEGLDDAQQREVLDYVDTELHRQVSKIPAAPGAAGRVRLRVAVTELQTPNRMVNAITLLLVGPVTTGGASLEFEAVDDSTGRRIGAATCFDHGNVLTEFFASYTVLGHAKAAITTCIERIDGAWRDTTSVNTAQI